MPAITTTLAFCSVLGRLGRLRWRKEMARPKLVRYRIPRHDATVR